MRVQRAVLGLAVGVAVAASGGSVGARADRDDRYKPPPSSVASVELSFGRGYTIAMSGSARVDYAIADAGECKLRRAVSFRGSQRPPKTMRVQAGRPIVISAVTVYAYTVPTGYQTYQVVTRTCHTLAAFVPHAGHAYDIINGAPVQGESCLLNVHDARTGEPPPDLARQQAARCPMSWEPEGHRAAGPAGLATG